MTRRHTVVIALSALAAGLALPVSTVRAADIGGDISSKVDTYLQAKMHGSNIPGLAVTVVRDGQLVLAHSYGFSNVEVDAATSPDSVFEIGALSKQFTAAAIMLLAQRGLIALDEPIGFVMPEIPKSWRGITFRHLLTHTSGLPSYTSLPAFYTTSRQTAIGRKAVMDALTSLPLVFQPGEKWATSSTDYYLLGLLIERVTGHSYSRFLTEEIFQPLGMASTRVNDYSKLIKRRVSGYTPEEGGPLVNATSTHPSRLFGSGSIVSTAMDLARWQVALVTGKLLKPASVAQMWTPVKLRDGTATEIGFAWRIHPVAESSPIIEYSGATAGFRAQTVYYPGDRTSVILLTNTDAINPYTLANGVHGIVVSSAATAP